ncbi:MAG: antirestriction protein ArdA [Alphaproteobacteria bacterium]
MANECKVWVGCLASYNAGKLHGEWIDVDGADELAEAVAAILKSSPEPHAEEFHICDHEGFGPVTIGEYESLEQVAVIAKCIETHGALVVSVALDELGGSNGVDPSDVDDWVSDHYDGAHESLEDWAENYLEGCGTFSGMPDILREYFDFARWAHDQMCGGGYRKVIDGKSIHLFRN